MEKAKKEIERKMTLEEYKSKYTKPYNAKAVKFGSILLAGTIGIIIFTCLLLVVLRLFDIHEIAGYVAIGPAVLLFVFLYIVPLVKLSRLGSFIVNVDSKNAKQAQIHNKKLRNQIADCVIDFSAKTENIGWYDENRVGALAIAKQTKDDKALKGALTEIFDKDIRPKANKVITSAALKVGLFTALSQSDQLDTAIVAMYNLNLVKDIVFLYGFRPSEAKMMRIYAAVVRNALIAYGASVSSTGIVQTINGVVGQLGMLGAAISAVVGSASQGVINGILTAVVGLQTKHYLVYEYHLQDILDDIELEDTLEEEEQVLSDVKKGIVLHQKEKKKPA